MTAASSAPRKAGGVGTAGRVYFGPTVQPAAKASSTTVNVIAKTRLNQTGELFMPGLLGSNGRGRRQPRPRPRGPDHPSNPSWYLCRPARTDAIGTRRRRRLQE